MEGLFLTFMIDPIQSLAFSMHSNPGVYALLLGSGVSRSAQIPTGWEITLDLIRKLAAASNESAEPDPERWFQEKCGEPPDYSKLLNELAKTPAERQQLLRPYFEPNEQEREEGAKKPTAAHRAIAQLVAKGYIRIIITTNFDRLIEKALEDVGIAATVLSSPDDVRGAPPLIHMSCCVLKLHGDYLDTRIRNTPTELDTYPEEFEQLLDRILDEFGLIVCGWSAAWDTALYKALLDAPSRRYTTYWAVHKEVSGQARQVIKRHCAEEIPIDGADGFLKAVHQQVESLEQSSQPKPITSEIAIKRLEPYLSEPRYRIQLSKLIKENVDQVVEETSGQDFGMQDPNPGENLVTTLVHAYETACSTLLAMATVGGRWAEEYHWDVWQEALERLATVSNIRGHGILPNLRFYPATLLLYALGLGAVASERLEFLGHIFCARVRQEGGNVWPAVFQLPRIALSDSDARSHLIGMEKRLAPFSDWIHDKLRKHTKSVIPDDQYTFDFDKLEILIALGYAHHSNKILGSYITPIGAFGYRGENTIRIVRDIEASIRTHSHNSPYVRSGIFGDTASDCQQNTERFKDECNNLPPFWYRYSDSTWI